MIATCIAIALVYYFATGIARTGSRVSRNADIIATTCVSATCDSIKSSLRLLEFLGSIESRLHSIIELTLSIVFRRLCVLKIDCFLGRIAFSGSSRCNSIVISFLRCFQFCRNLTTANRVVLFESCVIGALCRLLCGNSSAMLGLSGLKPSLSLALFLGG